MRKFDVVIALEGIADARRQWTKAKHEFDQGVNKVMSRLLHEAAANFMSAEEVSRACGLKANQVRSMMRLNGLDPKRGKRALSATAAEALATNANLLGIAPHEMDLMSPLAYLPMGKALRQQLQDQTVSQVHELTSHELADFGPDGHLHTCSPSDCNGECAGHLYAIVQDMERSTVSRNASLIHGINYWDDEVGCGILAYDTPVLITNSLDRLTCERCKSALIKGYGEANG